MASHALVLSGTEALNLAADGAVSAFFVMSGLGAEPELWRALYVIPNSTLGSASAGVRPVSIGWLRHLAGDPLLCVEVWAMPFMPLIAWFGRGSIARVILIVPIWWLLRTDSHLYWLWLFMLGGVLSRLTPVCPPLESAVPQWLGRVSYSLYLSHWPVMLMLLGVFGRVGIVCGMPSVVGVDWLVWKYLERASIALSRQVSASGAHAVVPIG